MPTVEGTSLDLLATRLGEREGVVKRTFGTASLYCDWASDFVKRAKSRQIGDYRAYCAGAVAGANALYAAISSAVHEAEDPTPDDFVRDYVGLEVGQFTRAAIQQLLSREIDVLLGPRYGSDWTEVNGIRLSRRRPVTVGVTEVDNPEIVVITGDAATEAIGAGRLLVARGRGGASPGVRRSAFPIVVETVESSEQVRRLLGASELTAGLVRLGYDDVDLFGAERVIGRGNTVRAVQIGAEVPPAEVRAVTAAQDRLFVERRHGIIPMDAVAGIVEHARATVTGLAAQERFGAEDILAGFATSGSGVAVPAALATAAAGAFGSTLAEQIGTLGLRRSTPRTAPDESERYEGRRLAVDVRGDLSSPEEEFLVLVKLAMPSYTGSNYLSAAFDLELWSPVTIEIAVVGFEVIGDASVTVTIEPGTESPWYAFKLHVLPVMTHSLVVRAVQHGDVLQQVPITTFPHSLSVELPAAFGPPADLRVTVDGNGQVTFWDRDTSRTVRCVGRLATAAGSRERLDKLVQDIDTYTAIWDDRRLQREIVELGDSARSELPQELLTAMSQRPGLTVHVMHPNKLDFPFELALLVLEGKEVFVGEVHAVTRWIDATVGRGVSAEERLVRHAALAIEERVRDRAPEGYELLKSSLREHCAIEDFDSVDRLDTDVLQTTSYQLLDVVAHLAGGSGLALKDGELRVTSFREPQSAFCAGAALVFLNACSASGSLTGLFHPESYPERLLGKGVGALIASTIPVNVKVGVSLARHVYEGLSSGVPLGRALLDARVKTIADETTGTRAGTRRLTALAYCAFGHPEMTVKFERDQSTPLKEAS